MFLTAPTFIEEEEYARSLETKVILLDGEHLATFMFVSEVGVSTESTHLVKRIDNNFFEGDGEAAVAEYFLR